VLAGSMDWCLSLDQLSMRRICLAKVGYIRKMNASYKSFLYNILTHLRQVQPPD
jgi:hypothetical protein